MVYLFFLEIYRDFLDHSSLFHLLYVYLCFIAFLFHQQIKMFERFAHCVNLKWPNFAHVKNCSQSRFVLRAQNLVEIVNVLLRIILLIGPNKVTLPYFHGPSICFYHHEMFVWLHFQLTNVYHFGASVRFCSYSINLKAFRPLKLCLI